jgi:hypothetical protein
MVTELYAALRDAGASERRSTKAAEAVAKYDGEISNISERLTRIESDLNWLKWLSVSTLVGVGTIVILFFGFMKV